MPELNTVCDPAAMDQKFTNGNSHLNGNKHSCSDSDRSFKPIESLSSDSDSSPCGSRSGSPTNFKKQKRFTTLINKIIKRQQSKTPFFSFEFFPPRTQSGSINLISRYVQ